MCFIHFDHQTLRGARDVSVFANPEPDTDVVRASRCRESAPCFLSRERQRGRLTPYVSSLNRHEKSYSIHSLAITFDHRAFCERRSRDIVHR